MNRRLWIGGTILALIFVIAVFGSRFAPYAKDYKPGVQYIQTDHGNKLVAPPLPPSKEHLFGTDKSGSDLFSDMLYGAKYTLYSTLLIAAARILIGGLLGMYLGLAGRKSLRLPAMGPLNAIPFFIVVYFFMIHLNTRMENYLEPHIAPLSLALLLGVVLVLLGVPGVTAVVQQRTADLMKKEFILAAKTLGAGPGRMIAKHIVPTMRENLAVMFLNEAILALSIMGQLGIFYVFVGGTNMMPPPGFEDVSIPYVPVPGFPMSDTFEWTGMIGAGRSNLVQQQWIFVFPLLGYVLLILGLHLLQGGLQKASQNKVPHI